MRRIQNRALVVASISLGLLAATSAHAASVVKVERSTWGASGVPDYVNMHVYVPDRVAENPPIVVASHSCSTPLSGFFDSISGIRAGADRNGFIIILPEAAGRNCWDVGTTKSLTHDGGGDTQAIAQMVKYALTKYNGNPQRVYAVGGSSGAMMTQALLAVYPDIFRAGAARAGVPAGCWADGFDPSNQWSGNCAGGRTSKTAQQWGDQVRAMYPGYTGHRPRLQIFHGTADATINYNNHREAIKEWTNVLGLSETPTSTDTMTTANRTTYDRQFWENECGQTVFEAWSGRDGAHSMAYEADAILEFFGLDKADAVDPEADCSASSGSGGSGGGGTGGSDGGAGPTSTSAGSASAGGGGDDGVGGQPPADGTGGAGATGGSGPSGAAGSTGAGEEPAPASESGGCAYAVGRATPESWYAAAAMGLALLTSRRRHRSGRR
ncbi:extracellular catalytic domain type 1 short-chain-length polyhydroxyalkanoate depolymerase [Sorangium sp. So ce1024]|uniref:extracellular catalytic domain type 1 short-chain-length polyhydroxyalkanoate depolymerase n=1 Tax=Sorangium sp. So ce1024 TaxID=3133327 RepID=UPI003F0BC9A4